MASSARQYSAAEEILHSITHGIGTVLSFAAIFVLLSKAAGDTWKTVSFAVYSVSLFILYANSTLYHAVTNEKLKKFFRMTDHLSIFFLIAGTYTPISLLCLHGAWGWTLFGLIWCIAALGITYELFFLGKYKYITVGIYVAMGWTAVVAIKPILESMPMGLFWWLLAGGIFYTGGTLFYIKKNIRYCHAVWHVFVLMGSLSHFLGIYFYLT